MTVLTAQTNVDVVSKPTNCSFVFRNMLELETLDEHKPPPRQLIPQISYTIGTTKQWWNIVKNSWIRIVIRLSTRIE